MDSSDFAEFLQASPKSATSQRIHQPEFFQLISICRSRDKTLKFRLRDSRNSVSYYDVTNAVYFLRVLRWSATLLLCLPNDVPIFPSAYQWAKVCSMRRTLPSRAVLCVVLYRARAARSHRVEPSRKSHLCSLVVPNQAR